MVDDKEPEGDTTTVPTDAKDELHKKEDDEGIAKAAEGGGDDIQCNPGADSSPTNELPDMFPETPVANVSGFPAELALDIPRLKTPETNLGGEENKSGNRTAGPLRRSPTSVSIRQRSETALDHDSPTKNSYVKSCQDAFKRYNTAGRSSSMHADDLHQALASQGVVISPKNVRSLLADENAEIEFPEFMELLEKIGPPPEAFVKASEIDEGSIDMSRMLDSGEIPKLMKVDTLEERSIVENTPAICKRQHVLKKMSLSDLENIPFFFGGGGFICAECKVSSHNLVTPQCYVCEECEFTLCASCTSSLKKCQIDKEISSRINARRKNMFRHDSAPSPKSVKHKKEGRCFNRVLTSSCL